MSPVAILGKTLWNVLPFLYNEFSLWSLDSVIG